MKIKLKKKPNKHLSHTKDHPILTRRDFLSRWGKGAIGGSLLLPGLSFGQNNEDPCALNIDEEMASSLIIDLGGGGHLIGANFLVSQGTNGDQEGDLDYDVRGLGIDDSAGAVPGAIDTTKINRSLGIAMHADSHILQGIQSVIGTTEGNYHQSVDGAVFPSFNFDDTGANQLNINYWLTNSGAVGRFGAALGTKGTKSGGATSSPLEKRNAKNIPVPISGAENLEKLLKMTSLANRQSLEDQKRLLSLIENFNLNGLNQRSNKFSDVLKNRLHCDFKVPKKVLESFSVQELLSSSNATITSVYDSIISSGTTTDLDVFRTYSHLLLEKYFGVGTIFMNGFDYHDGTRSTGDDKDFELGKNLGGLIKSAVDTSKNLVVFIITDGGVGVNINAPYEGGSGPIFWAGDKGTASAAVMLVINGEGKTRASVKTNSQGTPLRQIGKIATFSEGDVVSNIQVDTTFKPITSSGDVGLASGLMANYLALHGMEGQLGDFGLDRFALSDGTSLIDDYLVFGQTFKL